MHEQIKMTCEPAKLTLKDWQVAQYDRTLPDRTEIGEDLGWMPARVPGAVHYDLMSAGLLKNPYSGTRAAFDAVWVARTDWVYRAGFDVPAEYLSCPNIILKIWGIDTYSEIWLNGFLAAETKNAYRVYELHIDPSILREKANVMKIRVKAHDRMLETKREGARRLARGGETEGMLGKSLIRRYQRSFFTNSSLLNLGTGVLGIGINRPVELLFHAGARITDCFFNTEEIRWEEAGSACTKASGEKGSKPRGNEIKASEAKGAVRVELDRLYSGLKLRVRIEDAELGTVCEAEEQAIDRKTVLPVTIKEPELWWPAGYGKPHLYNMTVSLLQDGRCIHAIRQEIGVRTSELVTTGEAGRKTFFFRINKKRIYVRGQNHIPLDYLKVYGSTEEYGRLFRLLENQGVNLVRIWGGGAVEEPDFYSRCDRAGIMVWQELFLHSNVYPDYDEEFVREFLKESAGVLKQVHSHPSLCIVCGGNEQQEGWDEWGWKQQMDRFYGESLVREHLPPIAKELCPGIPYIYNSPHGGKWAQSPVEGECHNWGSFYNSTKDPLFVTETCWTTESYSRPETLKEFMGLETNDFKGLGWFDRWHEVTSLPIINRLPYSNWFDAGSLEGYLHSLEIEQCRADYSALSMFRFRSPSCGGVVYWSFNKGGPLFQFGCVDYGGRPMMSYYVVKRLYAGLAVNVYRDINDIHVMVSNQTGAKTGCRVEVRHLKADGEIVLSRSKSLSCEDGGLVRAITLKNYYGNIGDRTKEAIYACITKDGEALSEDMLYFCPFSEFESPAVHIDVSAERSGTGEWKISLASDAAIQLLELEADKRMVFSDDYFPLVPGMKKTVTAALLEYGGGKPPVLTVRSADGRVCREIRL